MPEAIIKLYEQISS